MKLHTLTQPGTWDTQRHRTFFFGTAALYIMNEAVKLARNFRQFIKALRHITGQLAPYLPSYFNIYLYNYDIYIFFINYIFFAIRSLINL